MLTKLEVERMTKRDLVDAVAEKTELTKKDSEIVVNAILETITDALAEGDRVSIVGFGTFEVRERAARKGINPRTKEPMNIPASKHPAFRAGKRLKEAVN